MLLKCNFTACKHDSRPTLCIPNVLIELLSKWCSCIILQFPGSRRASSALTQNEFHFRYEGQCEETKETIRSDFIKTVSTILDSTHGPCPPLVLCEISNVTVFCGERAKRSIDSDSVIRQRRETVTSTPEVQHFSSEYSSNTSQGSVTLEPNHPTASPQDSETTTVRVLFTMQTQLKDERGVDKKKQEDLLYALDEVYFWMRDQVEADSLVVRENVNLTAVDLKSIKDPELLVDCNPDELTDRNMGRCCEFNVQRGQITWKIDCIIFFFFPSFCSDLSER